mmetsp:Transcript_15342/g.38890  ORF Transcript_15342/g.38890 Transcript_15342/m.38890 type:complete len:356 (-) Transcript_15342:89-1156(-)
MWAPTPTLGYRWEPLKLCIAASFAVDGLAEPLRVWAAEVVGVPVAVQWAGYDAGELHALVHPEGAFARHRGGVNVLFARLEDLLADHPESLLALSEADCSAALERAAESLAASAISATSATHACPLVLCCPPASPALSSRAAVGAALERAHARLAGLLRESGAVRSGRVCFCRRAHVESLFADACVPSAGREPVGLFGWHAPFLERMAHAPYTPAAMSALAALTLREALRSACVRRKVLAVDCDGTLWRGAVAELGPAGVEFDGGHLHLQRLLVTRQQAGALVCLCSRNDEADVAAVFEMREKDMALSMERHVLAVRANWRAKSANLRELSTQLGLPLHAFLFLDDSAAECAEVL